MPAAIRLALALAAVLTISACEQSAATSDPGAWTPAERDVIGAWVVAADSFDAAAENIVRNQAERTGEQLSDAEVRQRAAEVARLIARAPAEYHFKAGGEFTSRSGRQTASGAWTLEGDIVTIDSPDASRPRRFRVTEYELVNLPAADGHRPVTLVRK